MRYHNSDQKKKLLAMPVRSQMVATGQPTIVAKRYGIPYDHANRMYTWELKAEEKEGRLGTWSRKDIERELNRLRKLGSICSRHQRYGNHTDEGVGDIGVCDRELDVELSPFKWNESPKVGK